VPPKTNEFAIIPLCYWFIKTFTQAVGGLWQLGPVVTGQFRLGARRSSWECITFLKRLPFPKGRSWFFAMGLMVTVAPPAGKGSSSAVTETVGNFLIRLGKTTTFPRKIKGIDGDLKTIAQ